MCSTRGGHRAVDLTDLDPGAVVRLYAPPAVRGGREAIGEVAARDRELADEIVVGDPGGELGEGWGRGDRCAERRVMLERMGCST